MNSHRWDSPLSLASGISCSAQKNARDTGCEHVEQDPSETMQLVADSPLHLALETFCSAQSNAQDMSCERIDADVNVFFVFFFLFCLFRARPWHLSRTTGEKGSQAVGQAGLQTLAEDACLGLQACCKEVCEQGKIAHTFLQALPKH